MQSRLMPVPMVCKVACAVLVCLLALVSTQRPDLATVRAVVVFVAAWAYGAGVLAAHLMPARATRGRIHG